MNKDKIWLIGAGIMARDYAKVLVGLKIDFIVIGRSERNAKEFEKDCNVTPFIGGLEKFLATNPTLPKGVINSTNVSALTATTKLLLNYGIKDILLEKPGVQYPDDITELSALVKRCNANVSIAYNRRFYAAVRKAKEIIVEDGGVTSFNFEFTEWSHIIEKLRNSASELNNWVLANSTHVIDTAFYLGGKPKDMVCFTNGSLSWHPSSSIFSGAGKSVNDALFSYCANWESPGRWAVEILTKKHRLIFKPLEKLQIQEIGSVALHFVEDIDYAIDEKYKPGLYLQTQAFIEGNYKSLCSIYEQEKSMKYYKQISGY